MPTISMRAKLTPTSNPSISLLGIYSRELSVYIKKKHIL